MTHATARSRSARVAAGVQKGRAQFLRSAILALVVAGCARGRHGTSPAASGSSMLVVIVRHAEKAALPANDPVLSDAGIARARSLDSTLRVLHITDVVVSHLQRTRLTADPLIARTHAVVHVVPIGAAGVAAHVQSVADTVRAIAGATGRGVLVVGHSNTVTSIVQALGGPPTPALCDSQYSQLFTLRGQGSGVTLTRSSFGAADVADATCAATMGRP